MTRIQEIEAREQAATHRHSFDQKYERSIPSCTVKVWECPCGVWLIRHFGCFNPNHDQNSLATSNALLAELRDSEEKLDTAHRAVESLRQSLTVMQPEYEALKEKLKAVEVAAGRGQYVWSCELERILKGGK